jgi:hypothetical protein
MGIKSFTSSIGIFELVLRWDKCINVLGVYAEKYLYFSGIN